MGMNERICPVPEAFHAVAFLADGRLIPCYVIEHITGTFMEQIFLALEILVECSLSDSCTGNDVIDICCVVTLVAEEIYCGLDDDITLGRIDCIGFHTGMIFSGVLVYNMADLIKGIPLFLQC